MTFNDKSLRTNVFLLQRGHAMSAVLLRIFHVNWEGVNMALITDGQECPHTNSSDCFPYIFF